MLFAYPYSTWFGMEKSSMEQAKNYINSNSYKLKAKSFKKLIANSDKKQSLEENISTETKAIMIMQVLKADSNWLRWYCKIINTLPENVIQNILEGARQAKSPSHYFAKAAKIEMLKAEHNG